MNLAMVVWGWRRLGEVNKLVNWWGGGAVVLGGASSLTEKTLRGEGKPSSGCFSSV